MALQYVPKLRRLSFEKASSSAIVVKKTGNQLRTIRYKSQAISRSSWSSTQVRKYSKKPPTRESSTPGSTALKEEDDEASAAKEEVNAVDSEEEASTQPARKVGEGSETTSSTSEAEQLENGGSRLKQRLPVTARSTTGAKKSPTVDSRLESDLRNIIAFHRFFDPGSPVPSSATVLLTPNLQSLLTLPSVVSVDMATNEQISMLKMADKSRTGIALIYSHRINPDTKATSSSKSTHHKTTEEELGVDTSSESMANDTAHLNEAMVASDSDLESRHIDHRAPGSYFGMYCMVSAVAKHKTMQRYELTLMPLRRIRLVTHGDSPVKSFTMGDIEEWQTSPLDPSDVDDVIMATLPWLPQPMQMPFKPFATNAVIAELSLHRIMAHIYENVGRHDVSGVRSSLETAFVERNLETKLALVQSALGQVAMTHELTQSIEEMNERRRLQGLEQQMERLLKQQLADPQYDPELKLATQIAELPEHLRPMALKEFDHMKSLDPSGNEYHVVSSYLDWLVHMPWNRRTIDRFDMDEAQRLLDRSHHGLEDVKVKIMQLMANASRTGKLSSKPLLFVGPPGTGKTSFAKAIADALGRKFISLAGLTETNDLRGHRRTYAGSIPGKIASEMRRCNAKNPVIVIDEIDKIEDSQKHRPITPALLELLSSDQNKTFYDQYLDTGIDCSEVLFICTANSLETISSPLLNRLQVVELRAYSSSEKFDIAKGFVLPNALEEAGLKRVSMTDDAIRNLVQIYSKHEAGVRQIRRHMQHIMRQLAVKAVTSKPAASAVIASTESSEPVYDPTLMPFEISTEEMLKLLDAPEYVRGDRIYDDAIPGVVNGLSKNLYGGSTLTIEAVADFHKASGPMIKKSSADTEISPDRTKGRSRSRKPADTGPGRDHEHDDPSGSDSVGKRGVQFTGNIMDTMKESSSIAYTYAKSFLTKYFPDNDFFKRASLHVHVPFGLIKKDGPSAGCALVCSYLSVAMNQPLPNTLCMTGEITLSGRVTAVGGIREKVTAACQYGMTDVILPTTNRSDFEAIPKELVSTITPHFVSTFEEAFEIAFKKNVKPVKVPVITSDPVVPKRKIVTKVVPDIKPTTPGDRERKPTDPNNRNRIPKPSIIPAIDDQPSKPVPISAVSTSL